MHVSLAADVLYAQGEVRVTRTMVTIGSATYPVGGISGVRVTSARPARPVARVAAVVFAVLAAAAFVRFVAVVVALLPGDALTVLFHLVVLLLPLGVALRRIRDGYVYVHTLWVRNGGGESAAFASPDVRVVGDVADAITRAVYGRR